MIMDKRNAYFSAEIKTRANDDCGEKYLEGYFAVYNSPTKLWGNVFEQIDPEAFRGSVESSDVRALFNHNDGFVLGRSSVKTLELRSDDYGLWGRITINPDDSQALDVYARVQRGDISGCSIGFYLETEEHEKRDDGSDLYTVKKADLLEVTVCTFPAYPQTEIKARKAQHERSSCEKLERRKAELRKRLEDIKCSEN